jgi:xanthine phosphoribosyltransferase
LTGVGICIEKGFQPGGNHLRELGIKVKSLAIVDAIANGIIQVRDGD